jgi:hypothetical protein
MNLNALRNHTRPNMIMKGRSTLKRLVTTTALNHLLSINQGLTLILNNLLMTVLSKEMDSSIGLRQTLKVTIIQGALIDL